MMQFRSFMTTLALLILTSTVPSAPAPESPAKRKLELLKKEIPDILKQWASDKEYKTYISYIPTLRRVRMTGANRAKITIGLYRVMGTRPCKLMTVYLVFYDGKWTAMRYEWSESWLDKEGGSAGHLLLDAIDEAAEK